MVSRLASEPGQAVRAVVRRPSALPLGAVEQCVVPLPFVQHDWAGALTSVTTVVHAAARVHQVHDVARDPMAEFRAVNVDATVALASAAARAGVGHFVFLSSIKVLGEQTAESRPFTADSTPCPLDPYAVSKWEAEQAVRRIGDATGMCVSIVRPPLVYGPGVGANFRALLRLVSRGVPLPFGAVRNHRSLVARGNLVDLLVRLVCQAPVRARTLLVSDGEDLSTPELIRRMGVALGRPARLVPVPVGLMTGVGRLLGRGAQVQRLFSSLQVDITATRQQMGWSPPVAVDPALQETATAFLNETRR